MQDLPRDTLQQIAAVLLESGITQCADRLKQQIVSFDSCYGTFENFRYNQEGGGIDVGDGGVFDGNAIPDSRLRQAKISGLDIAQGLERFDDDEATYLKLLRSYISSIRSIAGALDVIGEAELPQQELARYILTVHSIKGTSLDLSAVPVGNEAAALEKAARAGDIGFLRERNPAFRTAVLKLLDDMDGLVQSCAVESKSKRDKIEDGLIAQLVTACQNYDMDGADRVMAEIDKHQYELDAELADWLRESVDAAEFEEIIEKFSSTI